MHVKMTINSSQATRYLYPNITCFKSKEEITLEKSNF